MQSQQNEVTLTRSGRSSRRSGSALVDRLAKFFSSDRARLGAFICFLTLVALTGGSSRPDTVSLLLLRPAVVLFAAYALFVATPEQLRAARAPLVIVLALLALAAVQLVPLPATLWTNLPNRGIVAEVSAQVGMADLARPLSLDPDRTWNTLFALFVPLAAVLLVAVQSPRFRRYVVPLFIGVGLLSAVLGYLQAIGGNGLHFYRITHRDFPVGLFANKNHQSLMLLWLMIAGSWLATTADPRRHSANGSVGAAIGLILVVFPLLVLTGSRAGLLLSAPALLICAALLLRAPASKAILKRAAKRAKLVLAIAAAFLFLPLLFVFGVLATSERQTALSRLFEMEAVEDLRWRYLSIFREMAGDFMPFGSGFGSFEKVFNLYEPSDMLTSRYMNQAHNDLMQLAIEGGLPALAILAGALAWMVWAVWHVWGSSRFEGRNLSALYGGSLVLCLGASLVDYPIRTPLVAALIGILTAQLSFLSTAPRSGSGTPDGHGSQSELS